MARLYKKAIETFMSITGESDAVAAQKLEEHGGDLNEAVNAHFNGGDISNMQETSSVIVPQNGAMDIDEPIQVGLQDPPFSILRSARNLSPFSLIDPDFRRGLFNSGPDFTSREPVVSHPREVNEILIGVKDGGEQSGHSSLAFNVEDVTGTALAQGQETQASYIIDDDDEDISTAPSGQNEQNDDILCYNSRDTYPRPSAPGIDDLSGYKNDIEEEMVRAAIEASKREAGKVYNDQQLKLHDDLSNSITQQKQSTLEDPDLAHAVSLSLKTAEQEKALRQLRGKAGASELEACKTTEVGDMGEMPSSNGRACRLNMGSSSIQDDVEAIEEQPMVRHRSMRMSSASVDSEKKVKEVEVTSPSSPRQHDNINQPPNDRKFSPTDEWGGISSEEQDEAIMLEAALFGGIPEGYGYRFPFGPHQLMQNGFDRSDELYPQQIPHPPSPGLTAQRLIREQQDDEYLLSLQADREKELKAMEEAKVWRLEEQAAREVSIEEERRKEEERHRKLEEEQEIEKQLAAKQASLPQEPTPEDDNAVTLLVRMPDGSRRGRRFLRSDKLQSLFDFIDVGRWVKPGSYRLVRPYPRRAFDDGESDSTLNQQGLTNKQEALFLELI